MVERADPLAQPEGLEASAADRFRPAPLAPVPGHYAQAPSVDAHDSAAFPELDCVRDRLPPATIAAAAARARAIGVTAERVLIGAGLLTEEAYVRALAQSLGWPFEPLNRTPGDGWPVSQDRLIDACAAGLLPVVAADELTIIIAPRGTAARRLCALARSSDQWQRRFRLTTGERLARFVREHAEPALGERAAFGLLARRPDLSAAPRPGAAPRRGLIIAAAAALIAAIAAPNAVATGSGVVLSILFIAWIVLRAIGLLTVAAPSPPLPRRPEASLPVYTVIAALYREPVAVGHLVAALDALDWPPEKLDVKFVLEQDDEETRAALAAMRLGWPYEVIIAPDVGPRTKPKALNVALPFARGAFVTVFDAEDRPEPDQLRRAFEAFLSHDGTLACVQAQLTIDNTNDNWLTRMFTAEYAGLFDVLLPGLAIHGLPLPLGGSSNHFRTAALRAVGGWDPFNLTEDADLGIRLGRFGYLSTVIASTTYEEAPGQFAAWLRQRRRWFQGWMQTWLVHMRAPLRLLRELGPAGFATFQLVVGGTVLAALIHPLFLLLIVMEVANMDPLLGGGFAERVLVSLYGSAFVGGYLTSVILGLVGLARRRLLATAWILLLVPLHWLLLSTAAWQAVVKLVRDPYRWDKTEHGLARTSRKVAQSPPGSRPAPERSAAGRTRLSSAATNAA